MDRPWKVDRPTPCTLRTPTPDPHKTPAEGRTGILRGRSQSPPVTLPGHHRCLYPQSAKRTLLLRGAVTGGRLFTTSRVDLVLRVDSGERTSRRGTSVTPGRGLGPGRAHTDLDAGRVEGPGLAQRRRKVADDEGRPLTQTPGPPYRGFYPRPGVQGPHPTTERTTGAGDEGRPAHDSDRYLGTVRRGTPRSSMGTYKQECNDISLRTLTH